MAQAALGVLGDPQFSAVFGPGSRAEIAVAGSAPGLGAVGAMPKQKILEWLQETGVSAQVA